VWSQSIACIWINSGLFIFVAPSLKVRHRVYPVYLSLKVRHRVYPVYTLEC
jgi:hypothetical protein